VFLLALILLGGGSGSALAAPVSLEVITPKAVVGEELSFALKFDLDDPDVPIDVSKVVYGGQAIPYTVGTQSNSSFTMVVNGKTIRSSSSITKSYLFRLQAAKVGELTVGPFPVTVGDETYEAGPVKFTITPKPTSDNLKFLTEVVNPQAEYYPSQVVDLRCRILYRGFPGSPVIKDMTLPILRDMNFQRIAESDPDFRIPVNGGQTEIKARQGSDYYQGQRYNSLEFHLKFRLMHPGEFHFTNSIKMRVQTGRRIRQPSLFFGATLVNETRTVYADSPPLNIRVRELPTDNVPDSFNGAIGTFKIKVTPSSDTAIRVGDPITLNIEISGRGTWEFVKCPPIAKESAISDYFVVSSEPVVGEVNDSRTAKSFSVRLRVKSKTVKEIPPIAFTYFDISRQRYVTVTSKPVPITVFAASHTAKIVDFNTPEDKETTKEAKKQSTPPPAAPKGKEKLLGDTNQKPICPVLPPLVEISDNVPLSQTLKNQAPDYRLLWLAAGPLALVFALYLLLLYRRMGVNEARQARQLSSKAHKKLLKELKKLHGKHADSKAMARVLGQRLASFMEERFSRKFTELDAETFKKLEEAGEISPECGRRLLGVMERIDNQRYRAGSSSRLSPETLLNETIEELRKCDL